VEVADTLPKKRHILTVRYDTGIWDGGKPGKHFYTVYRMMMSVEARPCSFIAQVVEIDG